MDFGLSQDQKLLDESVRGFLADRVPITLVRELRDRECPYDRDIWRNLAELGAAGILIPETAGGSGLGLLDAAVVGQALGYAATPTPFLSSAVMAPVALGLTDDKKAQTWLGEIATGKTVIGVSVTETFSIREEAGLRREGNLLSGKTLMAIDAVAADLVLVAIDRDTLAVVRANAPGLTISPMITIDATRCLAKMVFDRVEAEIIYADAGQILTRMLDAGRIVLAADALGACESMIERAVAYAKERKQFGRVIGSFQSVKHMCAEMIADLEPARSLLWYAAHCFDADPQEAPLMASHVLAHVSEIGRDIASVSTQVHGGTGWTDEQNLHFWFKRIGVDRHLLGGPEYLRNRAAELQGFTAES